MINVLAVVVILLVAVLAFYLWRYMMIRALRSVVALFRENDAVTSESAVTLETLGLEPIPFTRRLFRPRDYKRPALQVLGQQGIIKMVEGPKFYLDEIALKNSSITRHFHED